MIRPMYDKILVRRATNDEKSAGGLFIPESAQKPACDGVVVAVGHGRLTKKGELQPLDVKPGDRVTFSKFNGVPVKDGDEELVLLTEWEIFGVAEEAAAA